MTKVYVQTYGCSLNQSDSEVMKGVLVENGFSLTEESEEADVLVINSCTVKSNPEQKLFHKIRTAKQKLVVTGCVPKADPKNNHFENVSVLGPKALSQIAYVVEQTLQDKVVHLLEDVDENRNSLPHIRSQKHIEIIPINAGCLSNCSYCKTKHARGDLQSYPLDAIEKQFREAVNDGAKEIWLTSQDTGAYGLDIDADITVLLNRLLQKQGEYRIRLGMANPQFIVPRIEKFKEVLQHPNMFKFLHIPIQAGSNKVLKDMRRGYKKEFFIKVVKELTKEIPDLTIATDIIVGFPTETQEDFQETIDILQELKIPVVNISKFYPRPDTPAAKMKLLPTHIVKERSTKLAQICQQIAHERNASFVGKKLSVIIDEKGKKQNTLIARADNYLQVILPADAGEIGQRVTITPNDHTNFDVRAL